MPLASAHWDTANSMYCPRALTVSPITRLALTCVKSTQFLPIQVMTAEVWYSSGRYVIFQGPWACLPVNVASPAVNLPSVLNILWPEQGLWYRPPPTPPLQTLFTECKPLPPQMDIQLPMQSIPISRSGWCPVQATCCSLWTQAFPRDLCWGPCCS